MKQLSIVVLLLIFCIGCSSIQQKNENKQVNILWLFGEDIDPWMPIYGDSTITTPSIDFLANNGVTFTNCYSMSPVCSPARSGIFTGAMPTTIGMHNHRTGRTVTTSLPDYVKVVPQLFKAHGYHTFSTGKDDYNWSYNWEDYWTGTYTEKKHFGKTGTGSWNDRKEGQAFFGVIELYGGKNHKKPSVLVDPKEVNVPPYYPDIPSVRKEIADHYNQIKVTDNEIGEIIEQLKKDGLYENTIIVFFSDNGYKLLRDKQFLYDAGLHMPMVFSAPGNPLLLQQKGIRKDLISLLDLTATTLNLAGISIPDYMESKDLFEKGYHRDYIIAARDRCDFTIDRIRAVRTNQFKYIKNFMTDRPLMQLQYRSHKPTYKALMKAYKDGVPFASEWLSDVRPPEELYDLQKDPYELHNLAENPSYKKELDALRLTLNNWIKETDDKGQYPESKEQLQAVYQRYGDRCINPEYDKIKSDNL
ncbi:sulfatase family protein [Flammeovirga kamogawensis]|uniref:Sulfatase n=1 Tax=Flammeovirga kamogawensis TaxID=373891 RepID=A0ABX8H3A7_9BACT|nr:sulfatase [Flammeovirga kamogawensis]MBB6463155.1 arylsulfatase A-like enzyme [Flammeovirga kamogawensis]QWG10389.1 sulfatase [Flammeovirga kamogawensis]TRX63899.1 sulfatase [Flammeovirga kamogawensis]